jgi:hypothetical protein
MSEIGLNNPGNDQRLVIGKEVASTGKGPEGKEKALQIAYVKEGSEIIYEDQDNNWYVNELKLEDNSGNKTYLSREKTDSIDLDYSAMIKSGINSVVISFVEEKPDIKTKNRMARDPATAPEVLKILAADKDPDIGENSPDKYILIRKGVAGNLNTPAETLQRLADDPERMVRKEVAGNKNSSAEILKKLAEDPEWMVKAGAARNPNTLPDVLEKLAIDPESTVREAVAANPATPEKVLKKLAFDPDPLVRSTASGK